MKKALITMMCLAAMFVAGTGLTAQEITIVLAPGYNWISYPNAEAMPIVEALGSFTPENGDIIQSQFDSYCLYLDGSWRGDLTQFVPGLGYKYYSARSEEVEFVFAQPASNVLTTDEPTDITLTSAVVGGTVTLPEGSQVFMRGVCWGTAPSPDIDGDHTTEETGIGGFSSSLEGLTPNTTYYVRAYVVYDHGLAYGNVLNFTTETGGGGTDHDYVDLGLPSGTLWATCNVGADNPEDYGDYFAWGETQPKDTYNWSTYQYCMGSNIITMTKYCNNSSIGYNGFTDNLTTLLPEDDAATANWGSDWRMPTKEEWQELYNNTTHTWTTQNGVNGRLFTASNGNSLFLPAAGYRSYSSLNYAGSYGKYWSSSVNTDSPSCAWYFNFNSDHFVMSYSGRDYGQSVRGVRSASQNNSFSIEATASPSEGGIVAGTGNYAEGSTCTLIATANEGYTFTNWTENGSVVSNNANYTFTVNANRTLLANFTMQTYVVSISASPSNGGSVLGGGNFNYGQTCTVSAIANTGYIFSNWTENGSVISNNANYTFTVDANRTLVANYSIPPIGAVGGLFTINNNGDQVYFSQGNLQYQASTNTWKFADNQYDYVGSTNSNISSTYSGWIDLFGWGTSGYNHGAVCYQPWNTSQTNSEYYVYGQPTNNLYDQTGMADWGVNSISNGGNTPNQWRTLTKEEWNYVLNSRRTASGIRWAKARVNYVNGIIIVPDDWNTSYGSLNIPNNSNLYYENNPISAEYWESSFEPHGAVFLPAAGEREGVSVSGIPSGSNLGLGWYWSASYSDSDKAHFLRFGNSTLGAQVDNRYCGFSVRLVQEEY